jgi:hypothetical protein
MSLKVSSFSFLNALTVPRDTQSTHAQNGRLMHSMSTIPMKVILPAPGNSMNTIPGPANAGEFYSRRRNADGSRGGFSDDTLTLRCSTIGN